MKRLSLLAALAALAGVSAFAQNNPPTCSTATVPVCSAGAPSGVVQIKPQAVPTSSTVVAGTDAYLITVTISNPTGSAITFTLSDRQASPLAVLGAVSIAANTSYVVTFPAGYWCPSGFTVTSSGAGLTYYASWRQ